MGARQVGKSTLVRESKALSNHDYLTLDSMEVRDQAQNDPERLLERGMLQIIDEVQRAPDLVIAIKAAVDAGPRRPGRFVLTGSANLLAMKLVKESLAGRASYVTMWPMTRRERLGFGSAGAWSRLVESGAGDWPALLEAEVAPADDWRKLARSSAYPPMAAGEYTAGQEADWMQGYLDAFVQRDIPELSRISRPLDLLRLMRAASLMTGQVEHQVAWARMTGLPRSSVSRWIDLMETTYQIIRLPAFSTNRSKRLTRSPKIYWSDTAMALHLSGQAEPGGFHLENLVLTDLLAWSHGQSPRPMLMHWRTADQHEVDLVVELPNGRLLPIEVKAAPKPGWSDLKGLRVFLDEYADLAIGGLVLHGGDEIYRLSGDVVAAPWWKVV
jgi:predicted AAA+ superfamily ATPase